MDSSKAMLPVVRPVPMLTPVAATPVLARVPDKPSGYSWLDQGVIPALFGWAWRLPAGVFLCFNFFPLSFYTSVLAFGWLQRWMQGVILRGWWRKSRLRQEMAFHEFCATLGPAAPSARPRWFWHERPATFMNQPGPDGQPPGLLRTLGRLVVLPIHSFCLNLAFGIQGLLATYLVTGWGCLFILASWYFGWHNSFSKGYEDFWIGPTLGLLGGFALLVPALFYVPFAQAHQAATGSFFAFFQFRLVWRLIQVRLTAYALMLGGLVFLSLILEGLRCAVLYERFPGNLKEITPEEGLAYLRGYLLGCTFFFFPSLLLLRGFTALIYRSAMLKGLSRGAVTRDDLPPVLAAWLDRLELIPPAPTVPTGMVAAARTVVRWNYRAMLNTLLYFLLAAFVVRFYIGYFLVFNDFRGPLNHPVVQFPCIDSTPWHLSQGFNEEQLPKLPN